MLNRLIGIIYIIMNKGTVTAGELAERFEVSVRTIYRDVEHLSMAGIPIYARKGKNGGISLTERFVLDKMLISEEEQQRILAALAGLRETGAQEEGEILKKLGDFFKAEPMDWVAIDFSDWSDRHKELFEQLRQAILNRQILSFDYYSQHGEMSHRTVEPVQLLFKEYTWYLRAFCRTRNAMRLFKIVRMKRVEVSEETFDVSRNEIAPSESTAVLQEKHSEGEEYINITFELAKKEAYRVYDRFVEEEITELPNGDFRIHIRCPLDDWVYGLLLSFGPSAKVLDPPFVREEILHRIQEMQKKYL